MKNNNYIGDNIRYFMGDMTKAQLSRITGLRAMTIGRVLKGEESPQVNTLKPIAKGLGVPLAAIVCEDSMLRYFIVKLAGQSHEDLEALKKILKL
jgi:transcriptional regulator with XRE-family HTH domain